MTCLGTERYDYSDPRFFMKHSNIVWVKTNGTAAKSVPGVIKVGQMQHMVGRTTFTNGGSTYYTIGKQENPTFFYFAGPNGEQQTTGNMEVLACIQCANGGTGKIKLKQNSFYFWLL